MSVPVPLRLAHPPPTTLRRAARREETSAPYKVISLIFLRGTCSAQISNKKKERKNILIYKHARVAWELNRAPNNKRR